MNVKRASDILNNKEIKDIYYNNKVVWIQNISNDVAHIGFLDGSNEMDVSIADLHENK